MRKTPVLLLFLLTLFLSAFLLFCVQPMIAKMVLPLLGGSPAVWSTCMVFFQAALLAGYAYAHATTTWLGVRLQTIVQAGLLLLPLFVLPFGIPSDAARSLSPEANPTGWLFGLLLGMVALPFFVVATSAPLLQRWFTQSGHPAASDPYFLYGASNLGSMLALLAYPLVVEPNLRLAQQSMAWTVGYGLYVVLALGCVTIVWRGQKGALGGPGNSGPTQEPHRLRIGQVLRWVVLAFIPTSLMLSVTMYLTTDIAAMPLLWVIPLSLYLLTFILTFARRPILPHSWMVRALPMAAVVLALFLNISPVAQPISLPLHLVVFFLAAMVCHGELVQHRPPQGHLTAFYLAMSCGGVLGGLFNALIAPLVFDRIAEYPLALVLACLALPKAQTDSSERWSRSLDWLLPLCLGILTWGLVTVLQPRSGSPQDDLHAKLAFGLAGLVCYAFKDRPVRFGLGLGAVLLVAGTYTSSYGRVLYQHRSYFGVLRVAYVASGNFNRLIHGHTLHGQQSLDPERRLEPLTYYHRTGPIGQVFEVLRTRDPGSDVALVGLGAGSLACYAEPGQRMTFFEIDPVVAKIARDRRYFTFLDDSRAASIAVVLGDARLRLNDAPDHAYGLIVLDAFSSDAIPTHLLTREALQLYRAKLGKGGILAFHISNQWIDLAPILGALARDAGLQCLVRRDLDISPAEARCGKEPSIWAVMAARDADLGSLSNDSRWTPPQGRPNEAVWTDDFSSIIEHLRLN
ncbi:MAG: spermidine synthase [Isosphaeraceae bacterium]